MVCLLVFFFCSLPIYMGADIASATCTQVCKKRVIDLLKTTFEIGDLRAHM
jgi:hypothetical protein